MLFTLLLTVPLAFCPALAVAEPLAACAFAPRPAATPTREITSFANCGTEKSDGTAEIAAGPFAELDFSHDGLASIRLGEHFYYLRKDGRSARVPAWDNWADDFAEGLVRTVRGIEGAEKFGYLDRELAVVIAPLFDFAYPFEGGRALVCIGCRAGAPDGDGHSMVSGGLWGYVDRTGKAIVPVKFSREELMKQTDRD
ncbi:MAG: WG repeat-containing protein [Thermoanaerobaculia bacterium]